MDALAILQEVSAAYRILHTLSLEATIIMESGDEYSNNRNLQRIRFSYLRPNFLSFEPLGKAGVTIIADGHHLHTISRHPHIPRSPQHSSVLLADAPDLPHSFRWDIPRANALIFHNIDKHVASAEILRKEEGCHVVSVTYEPSRYSGTMITKGLLFWIDESTHIVMRSQVDVGHRRPTEDEINWTRNSLSVQQIQLNEPVPPETFQFTPPVDASPSPVKDDEASESAAAQEAAVSASTQTTLKKPPRPTTLTIGTATPSSKRPNGKSAAKPSPSNAA